MERKFHFGTRPSGFGLGEASLTVTLLASLLRGANIPNTSYNEP